MSNLILLYNLRFTAGQRRQPRHAGALRALNGIIKSAGIAHSYGEYDRTVNARLMSKASYSGGSRGYVGKIHGDDFIYRVAGIKELAIDKSITWISRIRSGQPPRELFRLVNQDYKRSRNWLPLNRYAVGELSGYRNVTFWTTHELQPATIVHDSHLIGLTNNWLKEWSVIIRCRVKDLIGANSVRVPTVLDAFTEQIFHPTEDSPRPSSGITIELSAAGPLAPGKMEFVLDPIRTDKLQIRPCFISNKSLPCIHSKDRGLWKLLDRYYRTL
jgi:hypothetical protein